MSCRKRIQNVRDSTSCDADKMMFRSTSNRVVCREATPGYQKSSQYDHDTQWRCMPHRSGFGGMSDGNRDDTTESRRRQNCREYADLCCWEYGWCEWQTIRMIRWCANEKYVMHGTLLEENTMEWWMVHRGMVRWWRDTNGGNERPRKAYRPPVLVDRCKVVNRPRLICMAGL